MQTWIFYLDILRVNLMHEHAHEYTGVFHAWTSVKPVEDCRKCALKQKQIIFNGLNSDSVALSFKQIWRAPLWVAGTDF